MKTWTRVAVFPDSEPLDWSSWVELFRRYGQEGSEILEQPPAICAYFPGESLPEGLLEACQTRGAKVETSQLEEQNWAESWKQFFVPRRMGKRWLVTPSWVEVYPEPGLVTIVLDPGQAFGTGDHPTTRMCLELLEDRVFPGAEVADIGCGSGILSIAAKLLGAGPTVAVDHDPVSVASSTENASRNNVEFESAEGVGFEPIEPGRTFDLVFSNIISAALISLAPDAALRVRTGGLWLVSGILTSNWPDVLAAAHRVGFGLEVLQEDAGWIAAILRR